MDTDDIEENIGSTIHMVRVGQEYVEINGHNLAECFHKLCDKLKEMERKEMEKS